MFVLILLLSILSPIGLTAQAPSHTESVTQSATQFAVDLYRHIDQEKENVFYSPYSIYTVLSLLYGGARGETAEQIAATIHLNLEPDEFQSALAQIQGMIESIQEKGDVQLSIANSLWPQTGARLVAEFLELAGRYRAEARPVNYRTDPEGARKEINS